MILWDESHDHDGPNTHYAGDLKAFGRLLSEAVRSGLPFRVGYDGMRHPKLFEGFCRLVACVLDGRVDTHLVVEEMGRVTAHPGDAAYWHGKLLVEGRKYGLIHHGIDQRSQKISKTALESSPTWWVGPQQGGSISRIAGYTGIPEDEIRSLSELEFLVWSESAGATHTRKRLSYQK